MIPPGHYETIYENFVPFGMGTVGLRRGKGEKMVGVVEGEEVPVEEVGKGEALVRADGEKWRSMDVRMGSDV